MDDLERRIIQLEHQAKSDRQLTQVHLDVLYRRLTTLESHPLRQIPLGTIFRISLALLLPVIVWLVTGDLGKAIRAAMR
jgi:hypothetical protein